MTFDFNNYTFNGYGEFWLLWVDFQSYDSFNLQLRMTQPEPGPRKLRRSILFIPVIHVCMVTLSCNGFESGHKFGAPYCMLHVLCVDGAINGSKITAVVMQESMLDDVTIPEVQVQLADDNSQKRLEVLYHGMEVDLAAPGMQHQEKLCKSQSRTLSLLTSCS